MAGKKELPIPRYVPVAEYEIGCCYYGHAKPFKTMKVKADSLEEAMILGRKLLTPSTVQHVVHISTSPNPDYLAYTEERRTP